MIALALAACEGNTPAPDGSGSWTTTDTGTPPLPGPCWQTPCASDVAAAAWSADVEGANAGQEVTAADGLVLVGVPFGAPYGSTLPYVQLLGAGLEPLNRWEGRDPNDLTGAAVAIGPVVAGERLLGIGQANGVPGSNAVLVRASEPPGGLPRTQHLVVWFDGHQHGGASAAFATVGADDTEWFVVGASGASGIAPLPGELVAVQADAEGEFDVTTVPLRITGDPGFGEQFTAWDAEGDSQLDLVTSGADDGAYLFGGPWIGHGSSVDRTGSWVEPAGSAAGPGEAIASLGDVTGDGYADLAFSSPTWGEQPYRTGHVYLVPGGSDLRFGPVEDLPIQVHGEVEGDGMGFGLAGADVSGDGSSDLVVGASGVWPGDVPGSVLLFRGPIADGTYVAGDADAAVHGEYLYDNFGRSIATVDADGDAAIDLVVGAQGWPGGYASGKVYLLPGASLFPDD